MTRAAALPPAPALGAAPTVAGQISARHTLLVGGAEGLDGLCAFAFGLLGRLDQAKVLPPDAPREVLDPAKRVEHLGFDPVSAAGWAAIGIDPAAGVAIVLDDRLATREAPTPMFWARVTDPQKALAALRRFAPDAALEPDGGAVRFKGEVVLLARKGEWTVAVPATGEDAAALRGRIDAALAEDGPTLAADEALRPAVALGEGPRAFGFVGAVAWSGLMTGDAEAKIAAGLATRLPGAGFFAGPKSGGARVLAVPEARDALRRMLHSPAKPAALARHVPADRIAVRFTLNIAEGFDGLADLLPDSMAAQKGQILIAKNVVPVGVGVSYEDLAAAFTGQVVIVTGLPDPQTGGPPIAGLLGVADPAKADAALRTLLDRFTKQQAGTSLVPIEAAGQKGFEIQPMGLQVVRVGDTVIISGSGQKAEDLIAPAASFAGGPAASTIDGDVVLGWVVPPSVIREPPMPAEALPALRLLWDDLLPDKLFHTALRIDAAGLYLGGEGGEGVSAGLLAMTAPAIGIPAFQKYIRRSRSSEAVVNVRRLESAVEAYRAENGKLPEATPLTPASDACALGAHRMTSTPETWAHPTWKALNFSVEGAHSYRYAFEPDAAGKGFTVRAVGDQDCDGELATFEWIVEGDAPGRLRVTAELE